MIKHAFVVGISLAILSVATAHAACSSYPYTLTNGSTADASQVMANFNCVLGSPSFTGPVGIGTTSPSSKLTVSTTTTDDGIFATNGTKWTNIMPGTVGSGSYNSLVQAGDNTIIFSGGSAGTGALTIAPWGGTSGIRIVASSGNVGIGLTNPSYTLDVGGSARVSGGLTLTGDGGINSAGSIWATDANFSGCSSAIAWDSYGLYSTCASMTSSDARLKKEIVPVENGLATIMALKPVTYLWKQDTKNRTLVTDKAKKAENYGFIAQDVLKVLPDLVGEAVVPTSISDRLPAGSKLDGPTYSLNYEGLIAPTIKAIQELYVQSTAANDATDKAIKELKADNDNLRAEHEADAKAIAADAKAIEELRAAVEVLKAKRL